MIVQRSAFALLCCVVVETCDVRRSCDCAFRLVIPTHHRAASSAGAGTLLT